ncbi:MAG TPA: glycine cleavage system aminomethyltransferase GcvT [Actinomycetota bacterium]|nr:glycine cleavage system aminomethyltransferase GcvT [Actinomycetota bacterium]
MDGVGGRDGTEGAVTGDRAGAGETERRAEAPGTSGATAPARGLRGTPLEAEHVAAGARMGEFAGWYLPIEFEGTVAEHRAVREAVGLFDLAHLGEVIVEGPGAFDLLQGTLTNDLRKVPVGGAQYNLLLNERGGVVDDLIVYRLGEERFLVVPNAANTERVHGVLRSRAPDGTAVTLRDDLCLLAVQGPRSLEVVAELFPEARDLAYLRCTETAFGGEPVVLARSGYTGERGYELFVPGAVAVELWRALLRAGEPHGIRRCGLGARDTLRLEMGYPLHGNDLSEDRTPLEAGLGWAVALDKGDFPGRAVLLRQREEGVPVRLWGLRMEDRLIPRPHYPVYADGERVGETTSGTFSPTLRVGIALAYLASGLGPGDEVAVDVRGRRGRARVVKPPFVSSSPR